MTNHLPFVLTAYFEAEIREDAAPDAPSKHALRTQLCPALTRFPAGVSGGWTRGERLHTKQCAYCQTVIAMQWQLGPISTILRGLTEEICDPEHFADAVAMEKLRASNAPVNMMMNSKFVLRLAGLMKASLLTADDIHGELRSVAGGITVFPVDEFGPELKPQFQLSTTSEDGSLTTRLMEDEHGRLIAEVECRTETPAKLTVQVEVLSSGKELESQITLASPGASGRMVGSHDFGPFSDFNYLLGGCVLLGSVVKGSYARDLAHLRQAARDAVLAVASESVRAKLSAWMNKERDFLELAVRVLRNQPFPLALLPATSQTGQRMMLTGPPKSIFNVGGVDGYEFDISEGRPLIRFRSVLQHERPPQAYLVQTEPPLSRRLEPEWDEWGNCWVYWLDGAPDDYCLVITPYFGA